MGRNAPSGGAGWTELFFLDEVTALAAGHRPCFYCRRERAVEFARCFAAGQGRQTISAPEMDAILHRQRWASRRGHERHASALDLSGLPTGGTVAADGQVYAKADAGWLEWSFEGWLPASELTADVTLLTPETTVLALAEGYAPVWHPSAG